MYVCVASAVRSPFVLAGGALGRWHPVDLTALVANAALAEAGIDPSEVDELIVGCSEPVGAQGSAMARAAALCADWPDRVNTMVVDAGEISASSALHTGAALILAGQAQTVCVAGVSSASTVQPGAAALGRVYGRPWGDGPAQRVADRGGLLPAPRAAEMAASRLGITRQAQDDWAARSHALSAAAPASASIISVAARPADGAGIQRGTPITSDALRCFPADAGLLPPIFEISGSVTSATFAPAADGAAALVLTADTRSPASHLAGMGRSAGDPLDPVGGVRSALAIALRAAGLEVDRITRWEITEPTAAAALLACRALDLQPEQVNQSGGSLSVGDAGAAGDLRLSIDGLAALSEGEHLAAVATGPTGAAVTIWLRL